MHAAKNPHRVALLEAVERTWRHRRFDAREGGNRNECTVGRLDLEVEQRCERGTVGVAHLRDDLITPVVEVEPVDVRAAQERAEFLTNTREVEAEIGHARSSEGR